MKYRLLAASTAIGAMMAAPVVLADDTTEATDTAEQGQADAAGYRSTNSGLRVVRDKDTGKLRAPNPAELRKMEEQEAAARSAAGVDATSAAAPVITYHADGMRSATLGPEYLESLEVKRNEDGTIEIFHRSAQKGEDGKSTVNESGDGDEKTAVLEALPTE